MRASASYTSRVGQFGDAQIYSANIQLRVKPKIASTAAAPQARVRKLPADKHIYATAPMPPSRLRQDLKRIPQHPGIKAIAWCSADSAALSHMMCRSGASDVSPQSATSSPLVSHYRPLVGSVGWRSAPSLPSRPSSAPASTRTPPVICGKAHYFLQTGIQPDSLIPKKAPPPQVSAKGDSKPALTLCQH